LCHVGPVKTRVRSRIIICLSHFVYLLCIDNNCKLSLQVFVYYFFKFFNDCLVFDVFSVERKYNVKVSTGKIVFSVVIDDDQDDGGGGNGVGDDHDHDITMTTRTTTTKVTVV